MPLTLLQRLVWPVLNLIKRAFEKREITQRQRDVLYKDLFYVMMGEPNPSQQLNDFCKRGNRARALDRLFNSMGTRCKLPQALYARIVQSVSMKNVQKSWGITKSDIDLINGLMKEAKLDPYDEHHLLNRDYEPTEFDWLAEVELVHEEVEVILNAQALEDMLLGVFETYKVPKSKTEPFSEVFGLTLGMTNSQRISKKGVGAKTKWFVYVEKAVPQIRAKANQYSVTPSAKSLSALVETSDSLFPQLEIIGDYHSHPFKNYPELKAYRGWSASHEDGVSTAFLYRDLRTKTKRKHRMRVSFVIAIAKGRGTAISDHMRGQPNIFHFNMAGCHVFITAYRILSNGMMTDKGVILHRPYRETYLKAG